MLGHLHIHHVTNTHIVDRVEEPAYQKPSSHNPRIRHQPFQQNRDTDKESAPQNRIHQLRLVPSAPIENASDERPDSPHRQHERILECSVRDGLQVEHPGDAFHRGGSNHDRHHG